MTTSKPFIASLQAFRALAFLAVFISHSHLSSMGGAFGVSAFFVLSGFLMYYQYSDKTLDVSLGLNLKFSVERISKIYLLYVIMTVVSIPFEILRSSGNGTATLFWYYQKIFFNLTLLQAWHPSFYIYGSFNGVAWFLSACLFLYFCYPYLQKKVKSIKSTRGLYMGLAISWLLQVLFVMTTRNLILDTYPDSNYFLAYTFPLTRLGDFSFGIFLSAIYQRRKIRLLSEKNDKIEHNLPSENIIFTLLEILCIVFVVCFFLAYRSAFFISRLNWFRYAAMWVPLCGLIIVLFVINKGIFTMILNNWFLVWLGNVSSYTYLIHSIIIIYVRMAAEYILRYFSMTYSAESLLFNITTCLISFAITLVLAVLYKKFHVFRKSLNLSTKV
jgi:peptidoglycan/LPS O-acetylase OafA/YrhL